MGHLKWSLISMKNLHLCNGIGFARSFVKAELSTSVKERHMMPLLAHRAVDTHISEILEVAETVVKRNFDSDLIDKVTVLKGYWELSRMRPEQDYGLVLSKALADLTPVVHSHL